MRRFTSHRCFDHVQKQYACWNNQWNIRRSITTTTCKIIRLEDIPHFVHAVTPLTMQQMKSFERGRNYDQLRLIAAKFLYQELPVRYACAIKDLSNLPLGVSNSQGVQEVIQKYLRYLNQIVNIPEPSTIERDIVFTQLIVSIKADAADIVPKICSGVNEVLADDDHQSIPYSEDQRKIERDELNRQLDLFFLARIGIRMLSGHHIESLNQSGGRIGLIDPIEIIQHAIDSASTMCEEIYGKVPRVEVKIGHGLQNKHSLNFMYVESHLFHMIFEILKNSLRATVERYNSVRKNNGPQSTADETENHSCQQLKKLNHVMDIYSQNLDFFIPLEIDSSVKIYSKMSLQYSSDELPPVRIIISQGQEDLTIKISDQGGGICRSDWDKIWSYTYSNFNPLSHEQTSANEVRETQNQSCGFRGQFSGGGYGLPISRLFARYFGGEITLLSMEGYGTDAYIQVQKLGTNTEVIPGHDSFQLKPLSY